MKKFALYTVMFFAPIAALVAAQNVWSKGFRFEARLEDGSLYVVDRRTGEVTFCSGWDCRVIRSNAGLAAKHLDTGGLTSLTDRN